MKKNIFIKNSGLLLIILFLLNIAYGDNGSIFSFEKININGKSILEKEAGISAYMDTEQPIDLELAKKAYRTIEEETDQYIIGLVHLPEYSESEDVHAYIQKDGCIVTYYHKNEPFSKIYDLNTYSEDKIIKGTKLETGIVKICDSSGLDVKDIKYYYFNYLNPFNPVTTIRYELPKKSNVKITIYNTAGQLVEVLVNNVEDAGYHSVQWNASDVSSGIYLYRIITDDYVKTKKCIYLK